MFHHLLMHFLMYTNPGPYYMGSIIKCLSENRRREIAFVEPLEQHWWHHTLCARNHFIESDHMSKNTYFYRVYTALDLFNRWHNATQSDSSANNAKLFFFFSIIVNLFPRHFTDYWYFLSWKNTSFPMCVVRMYKAVRQVTYCGVEYDHWCFSRLHKYNGNIFGIQRKKK